jgi:hypothetical protein
MNLQDYIDARPQKKIKVDIVQRWNERIMPRNLQLQGEAGAQVYLRDYGKSIAAPKCLQFGALALENGLPEFAAGFYKKAAELEGVTLEVSGAGNPNVDLLSKVVPSGSTGQVFEHMYVPSFPENMQPGRFAPMQPVDADMPRQHYITSPRFWGQPKIDGNKLIVFVTREQVWYQSRTGKLSGMPSADMDMELREAARYLGSFILEGELTFLDFAGKEHRTGSQAATANLEHQPTYQPEMVYMVFSCIWREGCALPTYGDMVDDGFGVAHFLRETLGSRTIGDLTTSKTTDEKSMLASLQEEEDREGEVWFDPRMEYRPGKNKQGGGFVRTKYLTEFEAMVTGFTETTAEGHAFGAMCIESLDGKDLGNVGTGFTREDKWDLLHRFMRSGKFKVEVRSQGFTESGLAWHARFLRIVE